MGVYNLNEAFYLWEDIQNIVDRIGDLYSIEYHEGKRLYLSKTNLPPEHHWVSKESNSVFNQLVPQIKSLHKDMYGLIEAVYKYKNDGDFNRLALEGLYQNFEYFRLLNNQFKHFSTGPAVIDVIALSMINGKETSLDILCQFKNSQGSITAIRYTDFIDTFLLFLRDNSLISFEE